MTTEARRIDALIPLWLGLRALGVTAPVPGAGRLLAGPFAPGVGALAQPREHRA
jgi:hypothetical protein